MLAKVADLPHQLREGMGLGARVWKPAELSIPDSFVVAGVGGSAIGADLLCALAATESRIPLVVCRGYSLPGTVGEDSLVVVSSYSGNTAEALSCLEDAVQRGAALACITSGGQVADRGESEGAPVVLLPRGYPPRAALGYSFTALLALARQLGICGVRPEDLEACASLLDKLNAAYSPESEENAALELAVRLVDRIPVIYSSNRLGAAGLRWKNQFSENSKKPAFASSLPELAHNDVMAWEMRDPALRAGLVFLMGTGDHERIGSTFALLPDAVGDRAEICGAYRGEGRSLLSQMFSLILLGDYASVYLALLRGLDPTPIGTIEKLKTELTRE
jgi:glucose/mannose-6-phosphate isomerase